MLVLVTLMCLACGYLGWAMNWKSQRHEFRNTHQGCEFTKVPIEFKPYPPILLWILGEESVARWNVWNMTSESIEEAKRLFPEADLVDVQGGLNRLDDRD
jgi:hypothetical protein